MSGPEVVRVDDISKRFGSVDVVAGLSFELRAGEVLGFLGPNGAGKTTTMRMLLDIIRPERGRIEVFGGPPGVAHQGRVGYLPEERGLYRDVTALDTLTYFGTLKGMPAAQARRRAVELLREVGLGDSIGKKAAELSRGMHQKVQVVATILHQPDLLILDEPFSGLDPLNAQLLRDLVLSQRARGAAVVMSTHDMTVAESLCDRILLIDHGRRLLYGTLVDIQGAFASGAVEVAGDDLPAATQLPSAAEAVLHNGRVRYLLRPGASASRLFRELAATPASVASFEVATPSLNEIFLRAVAGDERARSVR